MKFCITWPSNSQVLCYFEFQVSALSRNDTLFLLLKHTFLPQHTRLRQSQLRDRNICILCLELDTNKNLYAVIWFKRLWTIYHRMRRYPILGEIPRSLIRLRAMAKYSMPPSMWWELCVGYVHAPLHQTTLANFARQGQRP